MYPFADASRGRGWRQALAAVVAAASAVAVQAAGPLFESHRLLPLRLDAPLRELAAEKRKEDTDYRAGRVTYVAADGSDVELDVEIKLRGNFRRRECRYPPLRLRFDDADTAGTLFADQRRLKLVHACRRGSRYQQYVVEEYLLYRAYALLGDHAFRVRPLDAEFVDSGGKTRTSFAFLIEDEKRMARRYGMERVTDESVSYASLDPQAVATFALFQFLIGGHDWSMIAGPPGDRCCHNARLLAQPGGAAPLIPVPYDFDFAGIISPPYAGPPEVLPIRNVRQRLYRGRCVSAEAWARTLARFRARRADINALYRDYDALTNKRRAAAVRYIDEFYAILDDPEQVQRQLLDRCLD